MQIIEIRKPADEPDMSRVVAMMSGIQSKGAALEWGEKQAFKYGRGKVYWNRKRERVYYQEM